MSNKFDELLDKIEDVVKSLPRISNDSAPSNIRGYEIPKENESGEDDKLTIVKKGNIFPDMEDDKDEKDVDEYDDKSGIVDVPDVSSVDKPYKTQVQLEEEDEDPEPEEKNDLTEQPPENQEEVPTTQDPNQPSDQTGMDPNDPNAMSGMNGMGMGGMLGQDNIDPMTGLPQKTDQEIGRIYELKKIFSRLVSIESFLSVSSDDNILKLREYVVKAIELFKILIDNVNSFKDKIDDIIIMFYQFLKRVYIILKKYYDYLEKTR
jgi:hypothetical protein